MEKDGCMSAPDACTPHLNVFGLRICETDHAGRSVFATRPIPGNTVIEISPVLLIDAEEYITHGRHKILDSYTFVWEKRTEGSVMALALGLGSLFNHHPSSANVSFELDKSTRSIRYRTVRQISAGEELCICYGSGRMWWEGPDEERPSTPVSETHEVSLFGRIGFEDDEHVPATTSSTASQTSSSRMLSDSHSKASLLDSPYKAPLWRITSSPDPKTMQLHTTRAWAMDIPPRACSPAAQILKRLVKNGSLRAGDVHPKYSIRHLRSFRKAKDVLKLPQEKYDADSMDLSLLLCLEDAHSSNDLTLLLENAFGSLHIPIRLYLVRVPTGPAPSPERLREWSAVWPCVFLPPGAGVPAKDGLPGSDAARAMVPVDRQADAQLWSDESLVDRVRHAFRRCVATAQQARAAGELGIGVFVTNMEQDVSIAISVDAHDTRISEAHPLRHAVLNAVRRVAHIRSQSSSSTNEEAENGQDYLLMGLTMFITHEPCVYCAMALIHSRVRSVFFLFPSPCSGGFCGAQSTASDTCDGGQDGGPFCIHEQSGLNHKYEVWRWINPAELVHAQIDTHMSVDI